MKIEIFQSLQDLRANAYPFESGDHLPEDPFAEGAEARLILRDEGGPAAACCSLWIADAPKLADETVGCIGHFYAVSEDAARVLLHAACGRLAANGVTLAIGPMDGSTWRKYRFVTESNGEPPFLLEPRNPADWPSYWNSAGFAPFAGYHSSSFPATAEIDPRLARAEERFARLGLTIRSLDKSRFEEDLRRIHAISAVSFASNFLYSPIGFDAFSAMYSPFRDRFDPRFALIAELGGRPVGFVFSIPDLAQMQRGQPIDTLIIKTLAVLPERVCAGLGVVLVARMREAAREAGLRRVIHALMHDRNDSASIGSGEPEILRRYTLFAKRLLPSRASASVAA